eukprot:Colp12_sorted_trinity150504_noHs@23803
MSSRHFRRLQAARGEADAIEIPDVPLSDSEEDEIVAQPAKKNKKKGKAQVVNPFDLLNMGEDEEIAQDDDESNEDDKEETVNVTAQKAAGSKKKKKNKNKAKRAAEKQTTVDKDDDIDEIDKTIQDI